MKVTNFLFTFLIRVHRGETAEGGRVESADVFSAFVSPHKLINILSFSLSRRPHPEHEDNNIKNYCLTFMCHLANIFFFLVAWLFSSARYTLTERPAQASKELFYCFTFLSALMSFYCQSFALPEYFTLCCLPTIFCALFLSHTIRLGVPGKNSFR
jgi:hypothetical protein